MLLAQRCVRLAPRSARLLSSPIQRYTDLVQRGQLRYDGAQVLVLEHLSKLQRVLLKEHKAREKDAALQERYALERDEADDDAEAPPAPRRPRVPRGAYVFGEVGSGKSLCCDLFFGGLPVQRKRRVHFHQFMLEIHERIHAAREAGDARSTRDVISHIGAELAKEAEVLCFDEMQVTDVADAMIAEKLFASCWDAGMILVATSNRPPRDLYEGGLNREYFLPFVDRLEDQCTVLEVVSGTDHRRLRMSSGEHAAVRYAVERDGDGTETAVELLNGVAPEMNERVDVAPVAVARSRAVVPAALFRGADGREAAVFRFDDLCGLDRGAADYGAIAARFPFLAIADVPAFSLLDHDAARRFITLVDELYERRVVAVVVARDVPDALFPTPAAFERERRAAGAGLPGLDRPSGPVAATPATFEASKWVDATDPADDDDAVDRALELASVRELAWAFRRAASRLTEMASPDWPGSARVSES